MLVASLVSVVLQKRAELKRGLTMMANSRMPTQPALKPDPREETRLEEAQEKLQTHINTAKWTKRTSNFLVVSQYAVGATLTTSFVQSNSQSWITGVLGLVVLLASVIYTRFRPDLRMASANRRVAILSAAIRKAEDGVFALKKRIKGSPKLIEIRRELTEVLNQVDHSELTESYLPLPDNPRSSEPDETPSGAPEE